MNEERETPSPELLIGVLPKEATSVILMDLRSLGKEGAAFASTVRQALKQPARGLPDERPMSEIRTAVVKARPVFLVQGGSGFKAPKDLGAGRYKARTMLVCESPLTELRDQLLAGALAGATPHGKGEDIVWSVRTRGPGFLPVWFDAPVDAFVAIAGDRTLVIAPEADEARSMAAAIRKGTSKMPARWEGLLSPEVLTSPLVVVRVIDPIRANQEWQPATVPPLNQRPSHTLMVVVPHPDRLTMAVTVRTTDKNRTRNMLVDSFELKPTETQDGFVANVPAGPAAPTEGEQFLRVLSLYGLRVVI